MTEGIIEDINTNNEDRIEEPPTIERFFNEYDTRVREYIKTSENQRKIVSNPNLWQELYTSFKNSAKRRFGSDVLTACKNNSEFMTEMRALLKLEDGKELKQEMFEYLLTEGNYSQGFTKLIEEIRNGSVDYMNKAA